MKKNKKLFSVILTLAIFSCTSESDILNYTHGNIQQPDPTIPAGSSPMTHQRLRGIWVIGGTDGSSLLSEVDLYDPASNTWYENVTTFPSQSLRQNFAIASGLGKIYIFGGSVSGTPTDRVDIFDPVNLQWDSATTTTPAAVRGAGAVYSNGRFFLMGGYTTTTIQLLYEYNPATNIWTQRNGATGINQTKEDFAYCNVMGAAFNIGGVAVTTERNTANFNHTTFDYINGTRGVLPAVICGGSCAALARFIYFTGGATDITNISGREIVYKMDTQLSIWTTKQSMSQGRAFHSSAVVDGILYVFGGTEDGTVALDSVEAYDIINDTGWTAKTAMPRARFAFGATTIEMH